MEDKIEILDVSANLHYPWLHRSYEVEMTLAQYSEFLNQMEIQDGNKDDLISLEISYSIFDQRAKIKDKVRIPQSL